nr:CHC2 zinc finger domain-containing protein [Pedobacter sp. ASV19]
MNNYIDAEALVAEVDLVELLRKLGHQPVGKSGGEFKYHSPVRIGDRTPSFTVNPVKQVWNDFGLPGGGNLLSFAKLYWPALNFYQQLQKIREVYDLPMQKLQFVENTPREARPRKAEKVPSFEVIAVKPLGCNPLLEAYLKERTFHIFTRVASVFFTIIKPAKG